MPEAGLSGVHGCSFSLLDEVRGDSTRWIWLPVRWLRWDSTASSNVRLFELGPWIGCLFAAFCGLCGLCGHKGPLLPGIVRLFALLDAAAAACPSTIPLHFVQQASSVSSAWPCTFPYWTKYGPCQSGGGRVLRPKGRNPPSGPWGGGGWGGMLKPPRSPFFRVGCGPCGPGLTQSRSSRHCRGFCFSFAPGFRRSK